MSDPSERDEPSFVTNIERTLEPRGPSPLGSTPRLNIDDDDSSEATEVGTVPGPRLHRLHDDEDEPIEHTAILVTPDGSAFVPSMPMRPRMDSEAAGHWPAPGPNGAPLPISSDTATLHRSELVAPPPPFASTLPLGAMTHAPAAAFPSVPPPMFISAPQPPPPATPAPPTPRPRRGSAIYLFWFLVVGVIGGAGIALKLGVVHRASPTPAASESAPVTASPSPSPSPSSSPVSAAPTASEPASATPSAAPTTEPSAAPANSGRHGRPRRPRRGK